MSFQLKCQTTRSIPHFCHGLRYDRQMVYVLFFAIVYTFGANFLSIGNVLTVPIGSASSPHVDLFGKQRVWRAISFGVAAFSVSRFYEYFRSECVYIIMFVICAVLTILITCFIPIRTVEKAIEKKQPKFGLSALIPLLKKVDACIFLSITFVWGMGFGCLQPVRDHSNF